MSASKVFAISSALLQYPDTRLNEITGVIRQECNELSDEDAKDIGAFLDWLDNETEISAQSHYVSLFDRKRRACLYMSYYLNGDTRMRGMALVGFKELYKEHGYDCTDEELPDFLPTVLQFTAGVNFEAGLNVLSQHHAGVVVLDKALHDVDSPYSFVTQALLRHIPKNENSEAQSQQLITIGVPSELVGLEPFSISERVGT